MSRVGKAPITLPGNVNLNVTGEVVVVKGPLGELKSPLPKGIALDTANGKVTLTLADETGKLRAMYGTSRALLANCIEGVSKGWNRRLELLGVGYRAQLKGSELVFSLGYSHEVRYAVDPAVKAQVTDQTKIDLTSIDRQKLGQVAAEIRALRPPEPYKGKGVRYSDEVVRRKAGKAGKAGKK